jgi:SAM-dependent methyltransferase
MKSAWKPAYLRGSFMKQLPKANLVSTSKPVLNAKQPTVNFFDQASRDWDKAWKMQLTPWDLKGTVTPPLRELFEVSDSTLNLISNNFHGQHALVPGCGSGYDCAYLASQGYESVLGLDISPTAIAVAQDNVRAQASSLPANLSFEVADFFSFSPPREKFDFIFDYLFFAALDPVLRAKWAASMTRIIKPQTGVLATLVFPLLSPNMSIEDKQKGPPYPVSLEDYKNVLPSDSWEIVHINEVRKCEARRTFDFML